jgi:CBS domain-containing protein
MRDADVGTMIVAEGGALKGLVTDRDIVVRAIADGRDPDQVKLGQICSSDVVSLSPDDTVDDAISAMREHDIRRLPVVEDGAPVGIVALGDLAVERDQRSVLADISAAEPNN